MSPLTDKEIGTFHWHRLDPQEVTEQLQSSDNGLTLEEARGRLERFGPNELVESKKKSLFMMFLDQFKDFMILVLIAAAVVAGVIGEPSDTLAIAVIVALNAVLGLCSRIPGRKGHGRLEKNGRPFGDRHSRRKTRIGRRGPDRSRRPDYPGGRPGGAGRYSPD